MAPAKQIPTETDNASWAVALGAAFGVVHSAEVGLGVGSALLALALAQRRRNLSLREVAEMVLAGVLVVGVSLIIRDWDAFKAGLAAGWLGR